MKAYKLPTKRNLEEPPVSVQCCTNTLTLTSSEKWSLLFLLYFVSLLQVTSRRIKTVRNNFSEKFNMNVTKQTQISITQFPDFHDIFTQNG